MEAVDSLNVYTPLSSEVEAFGQTIEWWDDLASAVGYKMRPDKAEDEDGKGITTFGAETALGEGKRCLAEFGRVEGGKMMATKSGIAWVLKAVKAWNALKADFKVAEVSVSE